MTPREFITAALRETGQQGNMLEALWRLFAAHVAIPAGGVQWTESRRCFFAGALMTFEAIMLTLDPGTEPTEADLSRMDRLAKELERHRDDVLAGRA